ncbi:MAG: DUF4038 domain-containing protein [Cyclobacteriaceae bacterium]|nr:DUF4038 domain-containing protein [Cyclobacteriaceae bacterium]
MPFRTCLLLVTLFITTASHGDTLHPWEVHTLTFTARGTYSNPYTDIPVENRDDLLVVTFTGTAGEAKGKSITLRGCWNGGKEWVVNFAAPAAGTWAYKTTSSDRGLNGKRGTLKVVAWTDQELQDNATRRGPIRVHQGSERAGRYFEYADGTPFLWIGDTWWNWTKRSIRFETFKAMVDNRAEKGFTVGQLFVPGNGWGRESSSLSEDYSQLDTEHVRHVERMIQYANEKGITVWIHGWWSRENLDDTAGPEAVKRWWRYLIHRFGAYNVIWVLAGEYNMYNNGGFPLSFWKELGQMIHDEDPYHRVISAHNTPPFWNGGADAPQWSTATVLHDEPWLDYNQSQTGHGRYANEMIPLVVADAYAVTPPKPIVVTEPWYEFVEGNPTGRDVRLGAWGAVMSGAAGHSYGGGHVWLASVPESPGGSGPWPIEEGFARTTYDYEGARSMGVMGEFLRSIRWWELSPHPELVSDYPQPFCLARPGDRYVLYLRYGGYVKVNLGESDASYSYYWLNPSTGEKTQARTRSGRGYASFMSPGSYPAETDVKDWVLVIEMSE